MCGQMLFKQGLKSQDNASQGMAFTAKARGDKIFFALRFRKY